MASTIEQGFVGDEQGVGVSGGDGEHAQGQSIEGFPLKMAKQEIKQ
jgi:hypothetical protein